MTLHRIRQDKIHTLGSGIDDTLLPANHDGNAVDLQDTIDYICSQFADILGERNWYDAPDLSIAAMAAKKWLDDVKALRRIQHHSAGAFVDITVPGGQNYVVLVQASSHTPSRPIANVGTTSGAVAAELAGDVGSHALTEVAGQNNLNPQNLCTVWDGTTGDPVESSGRQVYALLQCENGASDGGSWDDTNNQGQLSFVRPNATYDDLEACPVADIAGKAINYAYRDRESLSLWDEQDWLQDTVLVDVAAAGVTISMDSAYDGGSQVDVDNTDVDFRLTDTKHFYISDAGGAARIFDVHAEAAGDEVEFNAPGGITINAGDIAGGSNKATWNGVEIGGAAGQVLTASGDLVLDGADDITFTTVRETSPLPLDDATAGAISALAGGPHASVSAAIKYALENGGVDVTVGFTVLGSNYNSGVNVPGGAGGLDISSPHSIDWNGTPDTFLFLNGVLQLGGTDGGTTHAVAEGDTPASGDVKFYYPRGVKSGDIIMAIQLAQ